MSLPHLLVAGLGNLPHPGTRHSLGQHLIDELAWRTGIQLTPERDGFAGSGTVTLGDTSFWLTLFKSKHFMNISGPSIAAACRRHNLTPDALIVLSDSTEHAPCKLHYRLGGSANGHNGLKSLISALGTNEFHRIRLGVGRNSGVDISDYVLGRLSAHEKQFWSGEGVDLVCNAIEKVAQKARVMG
ncbi:Peptidyl-tRNA hydrolase [Mycena kentingensis (nom. inval.)]|nr:Peptidyl-tRNA hydrolase [Mycena kentingensis (nom. inval.)]